MNIINSRGFWENERPIHWFDKILCHYILDLLKRKNIQSLVDFGCGDGDYVKYFIENEIICEM